MFMKSIRIEASNYVGRETDLNTIAFIAAKHGLNYDAYVVPAIKIYDDKTNEIILESEEAKKCYISGDDSAMEQFLSEIKKWIFD